MFLDNADINQEAINVLILCFGEQKKTTGLFQTNNLLQINVKMTGKKLLRSI